MGRGVRLSDRLPSSGSTSRGPGAGGSDGLVRRSVRVTGKALIAAGALIMAFVAYQLWGTGLAQQRDQRALRSALAQELDPPGRPAMARPMPASPRAAESEPEPAELGEAVALIRVPKIDVDQAVVEGVGVEDLKKGPGHYPDTPLPGEAGNAAIAGHRTTYGAPFFRLDELASGDPITVTTRAGEFRYEVTESKVVSPDAVEVLNNTSDPRLTLTTCNPRYSAAQRLIVVARLVDPGLVAPPPPPPPPAAAVSPPPAVGPASFAEAERAGLSGLAASRTPAAVSGALVALVWLTTWSVAKGSRRRWPAYLLGAPVFLVVLYVFFENVARLLPSNL